VTEAEWLACTDPDKMLAFMAGAISARRPRVLEWLGIPLKRPEPTPKKASDRKLRLYACACCRRIEALMDDPRCQQAVEVAERFADGLAEQGELLAAHEDAWDALDIWRSMPDGSPLGNPFGAPPIAVRSRAFAARAAVEVTGRVPEAAVAEVVRAATEIAAGDDPQWAAYAAGAAARVALLRELFGNPFQSDALDPALLRWSEGTVVKIAQSICEELAFDRLPILADALEEAGCDNADVLDHCHQISEHVRGCWVVDLLLGKS
jgi:hypothetical protein